MSGYTPDDFQETASGEPKPTAPLEQLEATQLNLDCAETILSRYGVDDPKLRRDIALTIDMAEEAAAANMKAELIKRVREVIAQAAEGYRKEFKPDGTSFSVMKREVCFKLQRKLATELEAVELNQNQELK